MICRNCGKEILDTATFCNGCGTRTGVERPAQNNFNQAPVQNNFNQPPMQGGYNPGANSYQQGGFYPNAYNEAEINHYISTAKSIHTTSIVAIIFSLGLIGLCCAISVLTRINKLPQINAGTLNPALAQQFADAQRKVGTAKTLSTISLAIFIGSIVISFIIGFVSAL